MQEIDTYLQKPGTTLETAVGWFSLTSLTDMDDLDDELAGELGRMTVRLDRAIQAVGGIGRVHVARWGDGGSHFHMWLYGRPRGAAQMLGFCLPMWAEILPPTAEDLWQANMAVVAAELAKVSGTAIVGP